MKRHGTRMLAIAMLTLCFAASASHAANLIFHDDFNSIDSSHWDQVSGGWSVIGGGTLRGSWSVSSAWSDHANYLLKPSIFDKTQDYEAQFTFDLSRGQQARFALYHSSGRKYNITYAYNPATGIATSTGEYRPPHHYDPAFPRLDKSIGTGLNPTARMVRSGKTFSLYFDDVFMLSFDDNFWNGDLRMGVSSYGNMYYDSFSLYDGDTSAATIPAPLAVVAGLFGMAWCIRRKSLSPQTGA